jgi:AraC family transcriptional regulator
MQLRDVSGFMEVGLSKFHFHRLFKPALGMSPAHYQLNLRMNEARRLLRETDKSVVEVALDVGYANLSHFAQLFRRENGLTPSGYRPAAVSIRRFLRQS